MILKHQPIPAILLAIMCILSFPLQARGSDDTIHHGGTITLQIENDTFYDTDRGYTQGMKLSWTSPELNSDWDYPLIPTWSIPLIERLPFINQSGYRHCVSFGLGQNMYTPEEIGRHDLIENDRPYAGITYLEIGFHGKTNHRMDTIEFDIGIVGRHSYAEDCQRTFHDWIDVTDPKGWKHQLHDEPIFNAFIERQWKFTPIEYGHGFGSDVIPHIGGGIGNAFIGVNVGGEVRFGWHLPNDFGTSIIKAGSDGNIPSNAYDPQALTRFGIHLFLALEGTAVAHDILLDGNTFRDSHSVEKKHFVACWIGGIGISAGRFKITYAYVYRTKEFETQEHDQEYGSISLSYTF